MDPLALSWDEWEEIDFETSHNSEPDVTFFDCSNEEMDTTFEMEPIRANLEQNSDETPVALKCRAVGRSVGNNCFTDEQITPVRSSTSWGLPKTSLPAANSFDMAPKLQQTPILNFRREILKTPAMNHKMLAKVDPPAPRRAPVNQVSMVPNLVS